MQQTTYSIDISYFLGSGDSADELNAAIRGITIAHPECRWYASDVGPGGVGPNYVSHGYFVNSVETMYDIIRAVGETPKIWIAFCGKTFINNGERDHVHLYYSDVALSHIMPRYADEYRARIKTLAGDDLELYNQCCATVVVKA